MIERLPKKDRPAQIALVTAVPSFVKSLTGQDAADFNRRGIHSVRVTADMMGEGGAFLADAFVDLYFLPAITGDYSLRSASNAREIAQRLRPYDLVIDLCEFSALYRRGITTDDEKDRYYAEFGEDADPGLLEYRNFLNVITALNTTFSALLGHVVRPRRVTDQFYEWGLGRGGKLAITSMTHGETIGEDFWAELESEQTSMLLDAVDVDDRHRVEAALRMLDGRGMETLSEKVMFSGYLSDMAGIQEAIVESTDPRFTFELENIFQHRRIKYGCDRDFTTMTDGERAAMARINDAENALRNQDIPFGLVDYYRITGGPIPMREQGVDEDTKVRFIDFRNKFEAAMAFARHWDSLEDARNTKQMNQIVNGWYMSNSCFGVLREARKAGLTVPISTWGVPTLMTNSIGLIPNADLHERMISKAVFGELKVVLPQPAIA